MGRNKNQYRNTRVNYKNRFILGIIIGMVFFAIAAWSQLPSSAKPPEEKSHLIFGKSGANNDLWDGPILWHETGHKPIHLILVEKAIQKLHVYRYDGKYHLLKTYDCATGERSGRKRKEKDEKTPEGIYFNTKTYRDKKITLFGDRAFGLNYPDPFDTVEGNRGHGIFIHGSDRVIKPRSTNGCISLNTADLAEIDKYIQLEETAIIIGKRLPYRFTSSKRNMSELIPFLKRAMLPEKYTDFTPHFEGLTIFEFENRVVALGKMKMKEAGNITAFSKLYLADPGKNLLVLFKREWFEKKPITLASAGSKIQSNTKAKAGFSGKKPNPSAKKKLTSQSSSIEEREAAEIIESWRRAWEEKRLNDYINHYHSAFVGNGKNKGVWKAYKSRLNKKYRSISVKIKGVKVEANGFRAKAFFIQHYQSDKFSSTGYKILQLRKQKGMWKIFREQSFPKKPRNWPA